MFADYAKDVLIKKKRQQRLKQVREQETQWARQRTKESYLEAKQRVIQQKLDQRKVSLIVSFWSNTSSETMCVCISPCRKFGNRKNWNYFALWKWNITS
jgi:hypothetical protein